MYVKCTVLICQYELYLMKLKLNYFAYFFFLVECICIHHVNALCIILPCVAKNKKKKKKSHYNILCEAVSDLF